jgi:2-amino-4-hydroxy-6-hydroxymethyldihydropteridine diphosphokinase
MSEVLLLLGGNMGNKSEIFCETRKMITSRVGPIILSSSIYETEPWGFVSGLFWNQALQVSTLMDPIELLDSLQSIENLMGRTRTSQGYEARPIDIDILFYDNLVINTPRLIIPHPLIADRKFVLVPLAEIIPNHIHPLTSLSIHQMLQICPDNLKVIRVENYCE